MARSMLCQGGPVTTRFDFSLVSYGFMVNLGSFESRQEGGLVASRLRGDFKGFRSRICG